MPFLIIYISRWISADSGNAANLRPGSSTKWESSPTSALSVNIRLSENADTTTYIDSIGLIEPENVNKVEVQVMQGDYYIPLIAPKVVVSCLLGEMVHVVYPL